MSNASIEELEADTNGSSSTTVVLINEQGQPPMEDESRMNDDGAGPSGQDLNFTVPLATDDERREDYLRIGVPLYRAAMTGDWEAAKAVIEKHEDIVRATITSKHETALHVAVAAKHKGFVEKLLQTMGEGDLTLQNDDGNTALSFAAACGDKDIAETLIKKNEHLPMIRGARDLIPIQIATLFGHGNMVRSLYDKTNFQVLSDEELRNLFLDIISADIYDIALKMMVNDDIRRILVARYGEGEEETGLHVMARKPFAIARGKKLLNMFQNFANSRFDGFFHEANMRTYAYQLVEMLWESVEPLSNHKLLNVLESPSELLFDAAQSGNVGLLVILIRSYPDLIWKADKDGLSIFHIAAIYRQDNIFNIIYEIGAIKDFLTLRKKIPSGDTMLHLVARLPPTNRLHIVSGAALQMQREILWFKAVEKIVPRLYIKAKNNKGEVAHELFTEAHKDLRKEGEEWMKNTATSCMLVATLIATVVFAAAFTIPGGNEDKTGFPKFRKDLWFDVFVLSNSVALSSSVISIAIFLSILTSRYTEEDFLTSLPSKLMLGLLALFVSIIAMVITFTVALVLIQHREPSWSLILITCLASLTSLSYALLHIPLWFDTLHSYVLKFYFHRRKTGLYS